MFVLKCCIFLTAIIVVMSSNVNTGHAYFQNNFYYPVEMPFKNKVLHGRTPVLDKKRCKENEYLYPGDNLSDWTCDCKPGFLYFPSEARCYEAYRKGPCKTGEILGLSKWKKSPKCIINQCKKDGEVFYRGSCQTLDSNKPCKIFNHLVGRKTFLTVKESTFELICADNDHIIECDKMCCINSKGDQKCFKSRTILN